jgi:hypothetical protein
VRGKEDFGSTCAAFVKAIETLYEKLRQSDFYNNPDCLNPGQAAQFNISWLDILAPL